MTHEIDNILLAKLLAPVHQEKDGAGDYLRALNLYWIDGGSESDLNSFKVVAARLQQHREYWVHLLRRGSWRQRIVGCTCLLVTRQAGFFRDLCPSLEYGVDWLAPQIAVTMGVVYPSDAAAFMTDFLNRKSLTDTSSKTLVSIEQVASLLGIREPSECGSERWDDGYEASDALIAYSVVHNHWKFWTDRKVVPQWMPP